MRMIDADALKEKLKGTLRYFDIVADIDAAPTIESERKRGKWIYYPKVSGSVTSTAVHLYPVCSECGCEHPIANFCPNCGADMREGEKK